MKKVRIKGVYINTNKQKPFLLKKTVEKFLNKIKNYHYILFYYNNYIQKQYDYKYSLT